MSAECWLVTCASCAQAVMVDLPEDVNLAKVHTYLAQRPSFATAERDLREGRISDGLYSVFLRGWTESVHRIVPPFGIKRHYLVDGDA